MKRQLARWVGHLGVNLGLTGWLRRRRQARGDFRVLILEYHAIVAEPAAAHEGKVSVATFRQHLSWLTAHFPLITVAEAANRLRAGLDRDYVALTFDDGYADNAELAFPLLREAGVTATIYLATDFLDGKPLWFDIARRALRQASHQPCPAPELLEDLLGPWPPPLEASMRRLKDAAPATRLAAVDALAPLAAAEPAARAMSWDQARELQAAGIELGAHTLSHPILSRLGVEEQRREIAGSLSRLAEELGPGPRSFAMPNGGRGDYDAETLRLVQELGCVAACSTRRGSNGEVAELFELRRLGVGEESLAMLEARLSGLFDEAVRRHLRLAR